MPNSADDSHAASQKQIAFIQELVTRVRAGATVVPLLGAGISIEAGVLPLSGITRYLAIVGKALRERTFRRLPYLPETDDQKPMPPETWEHLSSFGWPDPHDLNREMWHWQLSELANDDLGSGRLQELVDIEILDQLAEIDWELFKDIKRRRQEDPSLARNLTGQYWKLLLGQLTRSSPDLTDALFQQLTRRRRPATAHRMLALLAPILRSRLLLTINFDTLIEDAFRQEGVHPAVFEVADGSSLPAPSLTQNAISIIKLHGGSYRLLVGERLDTPLDAETRVRFANYLPTRPILLVLGVGGWDHRVLDMVRLVEGEGGSIFWVHFENKLPAPLEKIFPPSKIKEESIEDRRFLHLRYQDPGGFLRELYSRITQAHPATSHAYPSFQVPPIIPLDVDPDDEAEGETTRHATAQEELINDRVVVFRDHPEDLGLGSAGKLAAFVAAKAKTHRPVWIDIANKATVEDIAVDILQQLRRFDAGLPPEIVTTEGSAEGASKQITPAHFRNMVRRVLAALSRGRYVVAFNSLASFGRVPLRHDAGRKVHIKGRSAFVAFLQELTSRLAPKESEDSERTALYRRTECLGLRDSHLVFAFDHIPDPEDPKQAEFEASLARVFEGSESLRMIEIKDHRTRFSVLESCWKDVPHLTLLATFRRRRDLVGLNRLLPKYLRLSKTPELSVEDLLLQLEDDNCLLRVEGGDYWMPRRLRNALYHEVRRQTLDETSPEDQWLALATLSFAHRDLASYYQIERYSSSRDAADLIEAMYHRIAELRYARRLEEATARIASPTELAIDTIRQLEVPVVGTSLSSTENRRELQKELKWKDSDRLVEGNELQPQSLVVRCLRGLTALRETIDQERENLLAGVPARALSLWLEDLRGFAARKRAWLEGSDAAHGESLAALERTIDDIEVEIHKNRFEMRHIITLREKELQTTDPDHARFTQCLFDISRAQRRSETAGNPTGWKETEKRLASRLKRWRQESIHHDGFVDHQLEVHSVKYLRLRADNALWGRSPWDVKRQSDDTLDSQSKEAAREALDSCELALQIAHDVPSVSDLERSYLYSLQGRALSMLAGLEDRAEALSGRATDSAARYDQAYRQFDLSLAALESSLDGSRLVEAISALRRAECLMLHADQAFLDQVADGAPERQQPKPEASAEAPKKNVAHDALLGMAESRLLAARDLLIGAEADLETCPRDLEWWCCLFTLQAQLSVERLLLELSMESLIKNPTGQRRRSSDLHHPQDQVDKRFVAQVQELVLDGLMAIRRCLDVLLPSDRQRNNEMEGFPLLERILRLWIEVMVVGAYAQNLAEPKLRKKPAAEDETPPKSPSSRAPRLLESPDKAQNRWEQWRYLNALAGIFRLPKCQPVRTWYGSRQWSLDETGPLEVRGVILARVDKCLRHPFDSESQGPIGTLFEVLRQPGSDA